MKRGNGEGTIGKRADGRWEARIVRDGRRVCVYAKTRQEVVRKLAAAVRERESGLPAPAERQTVARYVESWLEAARPSLAATTYRSYEQLLRCHVVPTLGRLPLARLTPQHLHSLYASKLDNGLSPQTVRLIHAVIHCALGQATRWDLVARNVADISTPPRAQRHEIRPLTVDQVKLLLETVRRDTLGALLVLALCTGMRRGELLGLKWEDVDLERGKVQVRRSLVETGHGAVFTEPKTARSRRHIALAPTAIDALRRHRKEQLQRRLLLGAEWQEHDLVFPSTFGSPLDPSNMVRWFRRVLRRAELPPSRFHDLRHTCATLMLTAGVNPKVVQEMLGHSTIAITLDCYSHVLPGLQEDAASKLQLLIG